MNRRVTVLRTHVLLITTVAACGGAVARAPVPAPVPAPALVPVVAPAAPVTPEVDERCANPCRFLTEVPLAELPAMMQARCDVAWEQPSAACDGGEWHELEELRACIWHGLGEPFDSDSRWAGRFPAWWAPARTMEAAPEQSHVALDNFAALDDLIVCAGPPVSIDQLEGSTIWHSDLVTIVAAYAALDGNGAMAVPAKALAEIRAWRDQDGGLPALQSWTQIAYAPESTVARRRVTIAFGGDPDCLSFEGEDCEGGTSIWFDLDRAGKVVDLGWQQYG